MPDSSSQFQPQARFTSSQGSSQASTKGSTQPPAQHSIALRLLLILVLCLLFLAPPLLLIIQSFSNQWSWPNLLPNSWGIRGWNYLISQQTSIIKSIAVSISFSFASVMLSCLLCLSPAAALIRGNLKHRSTIEILLLSPVMVPPITFTLGIHHVFLKLGLTDTWIGVVFILTAYSYPYMLRSLMAGYEAIGQDYMETALNLGSGYLKSLRDIELPMLIPAIVSGGSVVFMVSFSNYFLVYLIGGGIVQSYSGFLFPFLNSSDRTIASVLTLIFLIIPLLLFILIDSTLTRWYRHRGMEASAS